MIRLIRSDGLEILLNADQIHSLSPHPDGGTMIRLLEGEEVRVKNHHADITTKIKAWLLGRREENVSRENSPPTNAPGKR